MVLRSLVLLLAIVAATVFAQNKNSTGVQIPAPASPTIPADAMFALGQQSGRLDGIDKRLGGIETDVKDIGKDVSRINVVMWIVGGIVTLFVAPIIVARVTQWINTHGPPKTA
jgi:hypothetical protein